MIFNIFCAQSFFILISPVSVFISHLPPVTVLGTETSPVSVCVINTLSVSRLPVTLPVFVLTKISAASERSNLTLPVLLSIESFSATITFFKYISPVLPLDVTLLQAISVKAALPVDTPTVMPPLQVTPETAALPVVTERSSEPTVLFSTHMFPVLVLILTASCEAAKKSTSPVLTEISALLKERSFGALILPVLSFIVSRLFNMSKVQI